MSEQQDHVVKSLGAQTQRTPLVLAADAPVASSSEGPTERAPSQHPHRRQLRFAEQPTTPAAPLHNLRDWMHLPTPSTSNKRRMQPTHEPQQSAMSNSPAHRPSMDSSLAHARHYHPARWRTPPTISTTSMAASSSSSSSTATSHWTTGGSPPARSLGEQAPAAGFLGKLAVHNSHTTHNRTLKRRYFVLQPGTFLYYFLSDQDTVPRGCLDLEGSWLQEEEPALDELSQPSAFWFSINWDTPPVTHGSLTDASVSQHPGTRKITLQAPSRSEGLAWMEALENMRLDRVQARLAQQTARNSALTSRVKELEQQLQHYRLVEEEKDLAVQDMATWRRNMEALDANVGKLSRWLLQKQTLAEADGRTEQIASADGQDERQGGATEDGDMDILRSIDVLNVPGHHFSSLYNACEMLRDNMHLAAHEAATAVEDLTRANERIETMEKRMLKAEKHLCKLWEENCALRKEVKQKKQEKRVLVKEVINLRTLNHGSKAATEVDATSIQATEREEDSKDVASVDVWPVMSEEERLINELENHVLSSIKLHERMLMVGNATPLQEGSGLKAMALETEESNHTGRRDSLPTASLFDHDDEDEVTHCQSAGDNDAPHTGKSESLATSISSTAVETSDGEDESGMFSRYRKPVEEVDISLSSSHTSTPDRPNPLAQLDVETPVKDDYSSNSTVPRQALVQHSATARLTCPLADVVGTRNYGDDLGTKASATDELQVYHLTFYSRKIGLQFQKIPPPPAKSNGLLTDAIKADLEGEDSCGNTTAAELRRIAAITSASKKTRQESDSCPLAQPVDAVIVCGFEGFNDSGNNIRPKLGARLVAFDGVSVEVGKWTFDSIRKAIQARDRPLTLSFRNDYLTTEQRAILTRAIKEVEAKSQPKARSSVPMHSAPIPLHRRRPSLDPSVQSAITYDSDPLPLNHNPPNGDDWSVSLGGASDQYFHHQTSFSSSHRNISTPVIAPRSFSDAGSSATSVLSAVGPLVTNLLQRSSARRNHKEPFSPEFLRRPPVAVEDTPQHADFCSELL